MGAIYFVVLERWQLLPDEWDALPWYHQQNLLERLEEQLIRESGDEEKIEEQRRRKEMDRLPPPPPGSGNAPTMTADMLREQGFRVVKS